MNSDGIIAHFSLEEVDAAITVPITPVNDWVGKPTEQPDFIGAR
jgi:hypothetical protein